MFDPKKKLSINISKKLSLKINEKNSFRISKGFADVLIDDISIEPQINAEIDLVTTPRTIRKLSLNKVVIVNLEKADNIAFTSATATCDSVCNNCDSEVVCPHTQTNYTAADCGGATHCYGCDTSDHLSICPCNPSFYPDYQGTTTWGQLFAYCENRKPTVYVTLDCPHG